MTSHRVKSSTALSTETARSRISVIAIWVARQLKITMTKTLEKIQIPNLIRQNTNKINYSRSIINRKISLKLVLIEIKKFK